MPRKNDIINSLILGELIFIFLLPTDMILGISAKFGIGQLKYFLALLLPFATAFGYWILYKMAGKFPFLLQLGRYGLIGVANTVMSLGIINFFILRTGVSGGYLADVFAAIAFILVVTNSFFWNKYWTFAAGEDQKTVKEYIEFFAVSLSGALINVGMFHLLVNIIGPRGGFNPEAWANIVVLIGIPISLAWNFTGYKFFVFSAKKEEIKNEQTLSV